MNPWWRWRWVLSMWADPDAEQRLAMVRWARRRLEAVEP